MKKNIGLILLMIFLSTSLYSQKMYVWCQKEQEPTPRKGFLENRQIDLVLYDTRILTKKSKIECESETIISNLVDLVRQTYPSASFNVLESDRFYQNPAENRLTIKIAISAYHAAFGADVKVGIGSSGGKFVWGVFPEGKWNAVAGYTVMLYDYENGAENKMTEEFGQVSSRPNTGGYRTAKNILNTAYIQANQELFAFIDKSLME
ncbi:hypothetical protein I2486_21160 [Cellulophaga sp. E16_2]|uniref:hypothetical protein n=1 Tax=Cellulophaga sp. E16_2 TaxID=2789297 RepID=UPI001A920BAC|nr:hypothetical protein [Cellulophaga sp. E16_2]MBO0593921.1 hypothetical protein [Cellulophaga sp. E16_2]